MVASPLCICLVFCFVFQSLFHICFSFCLINFCCGICNSNPTAIVTKYYVEIHMKHLIIVLLLFEGAPQFFRSEGSIILHQRWLI